MFNSSGDRLYFIRFGSAKILLVLIFGLIFINFFKISLFFLSLFLIINFGFLVFFWNKAHFSDPKLSFAFLTLIFFSIQYADYLQNPIHHKAHYLTKEEKLPFAKATIKRLAKPNSPNFWAELTHQFDGEKTEPLQGKIILNVKNFNQINQIEIGDHFYFPLNLTFFQESKRHPKQVFSYQEYLNIYHIFAQQKIDKHLIFEAESNPTWLEKIQRQQKKWTKVLEKYIVNFESFSILAALILGEKNFLDEETINTFGNTGAIHVLAVSGLHIGIVKLIIDFLGIRALQLFRKRKITERQKNWLRFFTLLGVWWYALLTGASDSVLRSACMLTVWTFGCFFQRKMSGVDALFWATIFLLFWDTQMYKHVGFQFSFASVLGILLLYPIFYKWFTFKTSWKKYIWQLTCIGGAAQIGVLPLSFWYFNKVSLLFWLSNPLVLSLATFLLPAGLVLLLCSDWHLEFICKILGFVLSKITEYLLFFLQQIEFFSFINPYLEFSSWAAVFCFYLILFFVYRADKHYRFSDRAKAIFILAFFITWQFCAKIFYQNQLYVYHWKYQTVFIWEDAWQKQVVFLKAWEQQKDSLLWVKKMKKEAFIQQKIEFHSLAFFEEKNKYVQYQDQFLWLQGHRFFILESKNIATNFLPNSIDYLIFFPKKKEDFLNLSEIEGVKKRLALGYKGQPVGDWISVNTTPVFLE